MSGYKNKIKVQNQEGRSEQERGADAAHLTPVAASWAALLLLFMVTFKQMCQNEVFMTRRFALYSQSRGKFQSVQT